MIVEPAYFDRMYAASADPWGFTSRWYEKRKYAITLAMLPHERYAEALEPGCSIGVMTEQLAPRCSRLLSCDVAEAAVQAAARRTAGQPGVRVEQRVLPRDWPAGEFDLIVFSEFLYYFGGDDLRQVLDLSVAALRPGGNLLAVHWRHPVPEYPRSGDNVHEVLAAQGGLSVIAEHREADFVAEVYRRGRPMSVAQATGLA
ncbi:MAG TPA: SAM-dependent methyltransferase [Streptosporangiaceae bacterium]|jgi:SAM-dependent methyltransferase|nr:SAM-dependent methyltransferase [Streptosporangiaceae bacterium]